MASASMIKSSPVIDLGLFEVSDAEVCIEIEDDGGTGCRVKIEMAVGRNKKKKNRGQGSETQLMVGMAVGLATEDYFLANEMGNSLLEDYSIDEEDWSMEEGNVEALQFQLLNESLAFAEAQ
ncbi:hypothetical protein NE237_009799 [Protea cynaroides]|uniref:Uncharacterized protein n=1 Tax=Protea cynaroides TaxID=273540 RepID=A0A9Q0R0Z6_9MAGN|nr:hypothetical protein NE237_009799 [Protea cynaroides]